MKRFMFALGMLATVAVSESEAGYLVIRIVLEGGTAGASEFSGAPMMGGPGFSGGPGGYPLAGGGPPPMIGPGGAPSGSLGGPPPAYGGSKGGPPPIGGSKGGPPPGMSVPGPMGFPGMQSSGGGGPLIHDPTRSIYVVVPYTNDIAKEYSFYPKKLPPNSQNPHWRPAIKHPFGYANLMYDNTSVQLYLDLGPQSSKGLKTRQTELNEKHTKSLKATDAQPLLDLVTEALQNGYVSEAMKYSDELVAAVPERKLRTTPQVDRFLTAYGKIKDDIVRPARSPSEGTLWKDRIGFAYSGVRDYVSPHYHILYWEGMDAEMTRRIGQLEDNFKAFYLLNAVRGIALPVPERPLIVVLAKTTGDVRKLSASLDGFPQASDGFFAPDHGIVVLSPERLDAVSQTFNRQIQDMFRQGVSRAQLLAGEGPKIDASGMAKDSKKAEDVARMMTWVVAERYAEEEGEWSAVSREGTRQLLHAVGMLPQHVSLPLWLEEGTAGFYQRPKGPVFTKKEDDKDYITVALTTGYGLPNYVRQKQFSEMVRLRQFGAKPDAGQVLRNVVTDAYFAAALAGLDADDPKLPLPHVAKKAANPATPGVGSAAPPAPEDPLYVKRRRTEFLVAKAQSTAWSLYYFLAKVNQPGLDRYVAELSKMPRDLPLGENARLTAFAKAFNLSLDGKKVGDQLTFAELGAAWLQYMDTVPAAGIDIALNDLSAPTGGPGGPGMPGGPPPMFGAPGFGKPGSGN